MTGKYQDNHAFIFMSYYGPDSLPDRAWIKTVKTGYIARAKEWVKDQEEEPSTKKYKWNEYVQVWIINKQKRLVNGEWEKLLQTILSPDFNLKSFDPTLSNCEKKISIQIETTYSKVYFWITTLLHR